MRAFSHIFIMGFCPVSIDCQSQNEITLIIRADDIGSYHAPRK